MKLDFDPRDAVWGERHERLHGAYARAAGGAVPVVEPVPAPAIGVAARLEDLDAMTAFAAGWANAFAASAQNDWPPFLDTYCTVPMIPEVFGCPLTLRDEDIAAEPVLERIEQVWDLTPGPLEEACTVRQLYAWTERAQQRFGTDLPVWIADIQSPFSVAAQIAGAQELLMACVTAPAAVHHLCRMVTDTTIAWFDRHLAGLERPAYPGRNFPSLPEAMGVCLADDTPLIMLGPEMYREFAMPYNRELGQRYGGLHIHCCGDYTHNLDTLLEMPEVRSFQVHAGPGEFPLPPAAGVDAPFHRARARLACFVDTGAIARGDAYRDAPRRHYSEYTLPRLTQGGCTGLILQSCGTGSDFADADAALAWTREALATATARAVPPTQ